MDKTIYGIALIAVLLAGRLTAQAQDVPEEKPVIDSEEVLGRIRSLTDELKVVNAATQALAEVNEGRVKMAAATDIADKLKAVNRAMSLLDFRWNSYFQSVQLDIADDDELMGAAADFQQLEQSVKDSLNAQMDRNKLLIAFCEAETFIPAQEESYRKLFKQAMELSMLAKLQSQLEKLKGKEALLFSDIQACYDKAKEAVAAMPKLQKRMDALDQHYVMLKDTSAKIQEAAYKPLFQRMKDWLLGLAAVSVLLMAANMLMTKYQAVKKAREGMKKMKEMMNSGNNQFYPTI